MIPLTNRTAHPMSQRLSISATVLLALAVAVGLYFAFAAVQGPSGILRRIQVESETVELAAERDRLKAEKHGKSVETVVVDPEDFSEWPWLFEAGYRAGEAT